MGTSAVFQPATAAHAEALAPLLRDEDLAEVRACGEPDGRSALLLALQVSERAFALLLDGEVAALFGLARHDEKSGVVWALSGRAVAKHPKEFVRLSKGALRALLDECEVLENWVDARYGAAVRWVRWMGFEVADAEPYGPLGLPFHHITVRRSQWAG